MRGALPNGKSNTKVPRISVPKCKVCHSIKGAPTCLSTGITGYVVFYMIHAISFFMVAFIVSKMT